MSTPIPSKKDIKQEDLTNSLEKNLQHNAERNSPVIQDNVTHVPIPEMVTSVEPIERELTPQEKAERKAKLVHRAITLLERGIVHDRLSVKLPPGKYGEWFRNDKFEIDRARGYGFEIDHEYAPGRGLHSDGTNSGVIGDVIFMITDRENYDAIEEARHIRMMRDHGSKQQREEATYLSEAGRDATSIIPLTTASDARTVGKEDIRDTVRELDRQTQTQTIPQR